jgi:hypothetical protein
METVSFSQLNELLDRKYASLLNNPMFIHFVYGVYFVCRFVCCVSFDRCVIMCDVCYL